MPHTHIRGGGVIVWTHREVHLLCITMVPTDWCVTRPVSLCPVGLSVARCCQREEATDFPTASDGALTSDVVTEASVARKRAVC